jgi:hypothetical protein
MRADPIGTQVNSVKNDEPSLITEVVHLVGRVAAAPKSSAN